MNEWMNGLISEWMGKVSQFNSTDKIKEEIGNCHFTTTIVILDAGNNY